MKLEKNAKIQANMFFDQIFRSLFVAFREPTTRFNRDINFGIKVLFCDIPSERTSLPDQTSENSKGFWCRMSISLLDQASEIRKGIRFIKFRFLVFVAL